MLEQTKICTGCGPKLIVEFNNHKSTPDGLQYKCRSCASAYYILNKQRLLESHKRYRLQNIETVRSRISRYQKVKKKEHRNMVWQIKSRPCRDCGLSFHPVCMDFDHTSDNKIANVSMMVSNKESTQNILDEISKCDIVCSNCHRLRTFNRSLNKDDYGL